MVVSSADGRREVIGGWLLGIKRGVEECRWLSERANEMETALPVVIKTREYGSTESGKELGFLEVAELKRKTEKEIEDLWTP